MAIRCRSARAAFHLYGIAEIIPLKCIVLEVFPERGGSYGKTREWMMFDSISFIDFGTKTKVIFQMIDVNLGRAPEPEKHDDELARERLNRHFQNLNAAGEEREMTLKHSGRASMRCLSLWTIAAIGFALPILGMAMDKDPVVRTLSSRADVVSGGDVLLQLTAPEHSTWNVFLNNREVTSAFHLAEDVSGRVALLTGLRLGQNFLEVRSTSAVRVRLELDNHPTSGPIFSGPHQKPFICRTEENGLGLPSDKDCTATVVVQYYYKSTIAVPAQTFLESFGTYPGELTAGFKPYDPSQPLPSDVAQTVTSDGRLVNYIVRREIGTINRAVYDIQLLYEPGQPLPNPWARGITGWNGRLIYLFGGGCGAGYHQGTLGGVGGPQEAYLASGYAVATATLNSFATHCNDRISAETLSMVKEHFIEEFGVPLHTIGVGGSGGAIQVQLIAQNYPGLLDGIIAVGSFADEATYASDAGPIFDCALLERAFRNSKQSWSEAQKAAVSGFASWNTCAHGWSVYRSMLPVLDPKNCDSILRKAVVYDRTSNPKGVRCTLYDSEINVIGSDPRTGFAYRTLDNVGVQYGLLAFNTGQIGREQFIELNENLGGYDEDGQPTASRTEAAIQAVRNAYERGLVLTGGGGLSETPLIDVRAYADDVADVHDRFRSFATRARLIAAHGNADNQVILVAPRMELSTFLVPESARAWNAQWRQREREWLVHMDRWLENIAADSKPGTASKKVARNRPQELEDGCWATSGERIREPATYSKTGRCNELYPPHGDPRIAAGGPVSDDIIKCALKPVQATQYSQPLSEEQLKRLRVAFPYGVCDYSRPGIGQSPTRAIWPRS